MAIIGYARVSTRGQQLTPQVDQLKCAGCVRIFKETYTGAKADRVELDRMLSYLRKDDVVIVTKLDRLARSIKDLLSIVERIESTGAQLRSLSESIDTSSSAGRYMFHTMGLLAEFERNRIRERTMEGLASARARGRIGGRPPRLTMEQRKLVLRLRQEGKSLRKIANLMSVSVGTVHRCVRADEADSDG